MKVYRQGKPTPTGHKFTVTDDKGRVRQDEWHEPNLEYVGEAKTFEEAKKLTPNPITEG